MNFSDFFEALGVPAFGTKTGEPINCGAGLELEDSVSGGADDSYMVVIGDVTPKMFRDFLASLASSGRKETFHREVNGNIFSEFAEENRIIYTYFTREAEQARVIIDNASCPLSEMNDNEPDVRGDTALMQFSLKYGSMVRYHSCDCGMLYVLRLRDNSVIIIDGGEIEQATEEACDEFMRRLEDLTNTEKGGKIRVAAWICTHNHDDHMDVFTKLLKREKDILCVEMLTFCYTLSGFMAALAGIVSIGRSGICNGVNAIQPYDTDAIAACIIGGASFMGGKGTMVGTMLGALIIAVLRNGFSLLSVSSAVQNLVLGLVIIGAVLLDVTRERMAAKARRLAAK